MVMTAETRAAMFSSATDQWATPQALFNRLDGEFGFTLDVCALPENAKCDRYFSPDQDGLQQEWAGVCWCNPPYGRGIGAWVEKAAVSAMNGATVVMLLPSRTDTAYFHDWIWSEERDAPRLGVQVRFIRGRLKFGDAKNSAPFPSVVVVFSPWR